MKGGFIVEGLGTIEQEADLSGLVGRAPATEVAVHCGRTANVRLQACQQPGQAGDEKEGDPALTRLLGLSVFLTLAVHMLDKHAARIANSNARADVFSNV